MQFIRIENGNPIGSPQSFDGNILPSNDWKLYVPTQEEYDINFCLLVDKYIESKDIVAQLVLPFPDEIVEKIRIENLRKKRNQLLSETDWTRMDDNGLDDDDREIWAIYRQELRDITNQYSSLENVVWPESP
jgi:hypothetical protein